MGPRRMGWRQSGRAAAASRADALAGTAANQQKNRHFRQPKRLVPASIGMLEWVQKRVYNQATANSLAYEAGS